MTTSCISVEKLMILSDAETQIIVNGNPLLLSSFVLPDESPIHKNSCIFECGNSSCFISIAGKNSLLENIQLVLMCFERKRVFAIIRSKSFNATGIPFVCRGDLGHFKTYGKKLVLGQEEIQRTETISLLDSNSKFIVISSVNAFNNFPKKRC